MTSLIWTVLQDAFWSGVAAAGFAVLFNVPRRALAGSVIAGALGHATRTLLMTLGLQIELATLFGAAVVGFLGHYFARRWRVADLVFTVPGVIPMVPGGFAFRTMIGLLQLASPGAASGMPLLVDTAVNATKTGLILAAIAGGITAPSLLFQRRKPVV